MKKITLLLTLLIYTTSFSQVMTIASTSFEEVLIQAGVNNAIYVDIGDSTFAHALVNNAGQFPVNQNSATELEVNASYTPYNTPGSGLTDGDFVGITNFINDVTAFTDGNQGYRFSDTDGNMILTSAVVDMTTYTTNMVLIDYFIVATGYEGNGTNNTSGNDRIRIYIKDLTNNTEINILNTEGSDINDLSIEGSWINGSATLPDGINAQLVVEFRGNSAEENMYIDNIKFQGEKTLALSRNVNRGFTIFPNPTSGPILTIKSPLNAEKRVVIYDILGRSVINTLLKSSRLNISSLKPGVYLVQITENNKTSTKKLVVR